MGKSRDVREAVQAELAADPLVDDRLISVQNIGGTVALSGNVGTYPEYVEAAAAARRVAGVTTLHNHLEVWLSEGHYRDDASLATAANQALQHTATVPLGVVATVENGNVTLTGTVSFAGQRHSAEDAVGVLYGVRQVENDIVIWTDGDPGSVLERIRLALDRNALVVDDSDVHVDTQDGVIALAGHVRTWAEHDAVVGVAWRTDGVREVHDELTVSG